MDHRLGAQLLVLAKQPLPGRVKTRLVPPLTPDSAAAVAAACLADTLAAVVATPVRRHLLVLEGDGRPPPGVELLPQRRGSLADRLAGAFNDARATCDLPVLLVGMDTPQVTAELLTSAVEQLLTTDAVLGLADDGGWWALGLRRPHPGVFAGIATSTPRTGRDQAARLAALGLRTTALPRLRDVDRIEDLDAVLPLLSPDSALAGLLAVPA